MDRQWNQFAPRIGIVWDPKGNGKMSVRAAYGIFYDNVPVQYNLNTATAPPWGDRTTLTDPPGGLANPFAGETGGNPFPLTFNAGPPYSLYGTYNTFNYDTHPPYVEQWNVSVERQFGNDWLLRAGYLGNEMVHLMGARELNPASGTGTYPANDTTSADHLHPMSGACSASLTRHMGSTSALSIPGTTAEPAVTTVCC